MININFTYYFVFEPYKSNFYILLNYILTINIIKLVQKYLIYNVNKLILDK